MKIQYLGTGAAEGIPALFCQCSLCSQAEVNMGKEIRTRAGAVVNDTLLLDLTPDIYLHKLRYHMDLSKIKAVCVTHSHTDHFDGAELTRRSTANYCHIAKEDPLLVYGNEAVCKIGKNSLEAEFGKDKDQSISFFEAQAYHTFSIGTLQVTPLPSVHDVREQCFIYLIEDESNRILYANDSGLLLQEVYEFLRETHLDMVSLDCTFGASNHHSNGHMGLEENRRVLDQLKEYGCVDESTVVLATHFSHNCNMTHKELDAKLGAFGIGVAYDGLVVELT